MLTITPPMNPRSTALEANMLTITPLMNPRSTALEANMLTITPRMWFNHCRTKASRLYTFSYGKSKLRNRR